MSEFIVGPGGCVFLFSWAMTFINVEAIYKLQCKWHKHIFSPETYFALIWWKHTHKRPPHTNGWVSVIGAVPQHSRSSRQCEWTKIFKKASLIYLSPSICVIRVRKIEPISVQFQPENNLKIISEHKCSVLITRLNREIYEGVCVWVCRKSNNSLR